MRGYCDRCDHEHPRRLTLLEGRPLCDRCIAGHQAVVADFKARPLHSHCSCDACKAKRESEAAG